MDQKPSYSAALSGNPQSATGAAYPNGNPDLLYNRPGARNTDSAVPLRRGRPPVVHNYSCDGPAPGNLAFRWTHGSNVAARNRDPRVQVVQHNEDMFVLRLNVCVHWEAPFTYLLFGNKSALLIDAGATADAIHYPLREMVDAIVTRWARTRTGSASTIPIAISSTPATCSTGGAATSASGSPGSTA